MIYHAIPKPIYLKYKDISKINIANYIDTKILDEELILEDGSIIRMQALTYYSVNLFSLIADPSDKYKENEFPYPDNLSELIEMFIEEMKLKYALL
jgi:hypothetical protein